MRLSRQFRFFTALLALCSVLFTQVAVAAYACPSMEIAHVMESVTASTMAAAHHAMPGCDGMEMETPPLCHDHGQGGNQSLDKPELPHVSPFIAAILVQALSPFDITYPTSTSAAENFFLTRATAPPLSIQNCCFRI